MTAFNTQPEGVQVVFEHNVEADSQSDAGSTPLLVAIFHLGYSDKTIHRLRGHFREGRRRGRFTKTRRLLIRDSMVSF